MGMLMPNDTSPSPEELDYLHHPAWAAGYEKQNADLLAVVSKASAVVKAHKSRGTLCLEHRPLRHPRCATCQLDARIEELDDVLEALRSALARLEKGGS